MSNINLDQNIFLFDLETTGLGFEAGVVQVGYASFTLQELLDGKVGSDTIQSTLVNPEMPIEPKASEVHGIYADDVMFAPKLAQVWEQMKPLHDKADFVSGFNSQRFDVPLLRANLKRLGLELPERNQLDVMVSYQDITAERRGKLTELSDLYGVGHAFDQYPPHDARGDVLATAWLLKALIEAHGLEAVMGIKDPLPEDVLELARLYKEKKLLADSLKKELDALRDAILETSEEDMETPYLTVKAQAGRTTTDWRSMATELGFDKDLTLVQRFTTVGKPTRVIRIS